MAIMAAMVAAFLIVALCRLGSFAVPVSHWQPREPGESFVIDLGRQVEIGRIYYYWGINENRHADANFLILYQDGGRYRFLDFMEKKDCGIWKFRQVSGRTSRLKIIAPRPGGALNELAVVERGKRVPVTGIRVVEQGAGYGGSSPANLFDEQQTFQYAPSFATGFYFDEVYHGRTAYEHLQRMEPYENTHPPLGKLFIASGIAIFGMNPFGWRIAGVIFGAAMLPAIYLFGRQLFAGRFLPFCAAFLLLADFMHFTLSRIALIDVYATFFIILMYLFMDRFYREEGPEPLRRGRLFLLLSGISFGLGAACKWITLYGGVGLAILVTLRAIREYGNLRRRGHSALFFLQRFLLPLALLCAVSFILLPAILYLLTHIPFLLVKGEGHGWLDVLAGQRHMLAYHSGLKASHPFSSPWWSWPLNLRPVWLYTGKDLAPGLVSTIATFGNPAVWWLGIPAVIAAVAMGISRRDRRMAVIATGLCCQYLPWAGISRIAFIYHFFSVLPFVILCQLYVMEQALARWPQGRLLICGYLALAALLFVWFYPALSGVEVPVAYINSLRWLKSWEF